VTSPASPEKDREPGSRRCVLRSAILVAAVVLLGTAGILAFRRHPVAAPAAQRLLARLTYDEGLQIGATWSPDSRFIAYSSNRGGKYHEDKAITKAISIIGHGQTHGS
jgi:hypothetical protein